MVALLCGHLSKTNRVPAAAPELREVIRALRALPGVRKVDCRLTAHA
jgi:hypothetical protein